jgi:hypothetical protein
LAILASTAAWADDDPALEAQEKAQASKQQMDAERKTLGAALKQTTGKSLKEVQNMSDAELDALSRNLERKVGK